MVGEEKQDVDDWRMTIAWRSNSNVKQATYRPIAMTFATL